MAQPRVRHVPRLPPASILNYLKRTNDMLPFYGGDEELVVNGYTDARFLTGIHDYKSQSGYASTLNGGAMVWKNFKQNTIADSTADAEYIVASEASKEAVCIKKFLDEVGVVSSAMNPMVFYCDNNGVVAQSKEPRIHIQTRHIECKYHIIP